VPFPDHLLDQARHLATIDRKRPRQASLRRAVSTAYYALFHLLTIAAAANWKQPRLRAALARAFDHRRMSTACVRTRGDQFPNVSPTSGTHLRRIARTFVELQQLRHLADYDNSRSWTRIEVLSYIEMASLAFVSWKAIENETIAENFLLQLLIQR
jgi:uncharacterized protein (UPF0332 family)